MNLIKFIIKESACGYPRPTIHYDCFRCNEFQYEEGADYWYVDVDDNTICSACVEWCTDHGAILVYRKESLSGKKNPIRWENEDE